MSQFIKLPPKDNKTIIFEVYTKILSIHYTDEQMPIISEELIIHILSYVNDVRTLRNFSLSSKHYYDGGGIPVGTVVRTCLMSGGKAKKTMEKLYPLIKKRSIHPPSARRLLTLATGIFCEYCKNTTMLYEKNNYVKCVRDPYGLHVCWRCVTKRQRSKRLSKIGSSFRSNKFGYHCVLDHDRTACKKMGDRILDDNSLISERKWALDNNISVTSEDSVFDLHNYMWKIPYTDSHGERAGPIMTHNHALILIRQLEGLTSLEEMNWMCDFYINEVLQASSTNHPLYTQFEQSYDDTIERACFNKEVKRLHKMNMSIEWRLRKINNAKNLLKAIQSKVTIPRIACLLTDYKLNLHFLNKTKIRQRHRPRNQDRQVPLLMNHYWVHNILKNALSAPTKCTKRQISELASSLDTEEGGDRMLMSNFDDNIFYLYEEPRVIALNRRPSWPWRGQRAWRRRRRRTGGER